jgi:heme exporter protein A
VRLPILSDPAVSESSSISAPLLTLRQLSCERDERVLFGELDLECRAGEVIQVFGPNGSGKTTLLRTLAGVSPDYSGDILWQDQPLPRVKWEYAQDLLYIGHLPGIKKALTPAENLRWYAAIGGTTTSVTNDEALRQLELQGYEDTPCYQLSAGQLRRVALARLYQTQARIWILDEPFTALDKAGIAKLEQLIAAHAAKGGLVILTSHQDLTLSNLRRIDLLDFPGSTGEVPYAS